MPGCRFPHGENAKRYNGLQKLAYCFVMFVLGPLIVLTGLTMSPTMDAAFPILPWLFGGRQTARTIHFLCAFSFFGFFIVHIVDGDAVGQLEQSALHDHRLVRRSGEETAMIDRRTLLGRVLAGASTTLLAGCYDLSEKPWFTGLLGQVEDLTRGAQHLFAGPHTLAKEYSRADIAPVFRANGTLDPGTPDYKAHVASGFRDWRVTVERAGRSSPVAVDGRASARLPQRTQITRHDCVEGWSCIGEWSGPQLALVLAAASPKARGPLCRVLLRRSDDGGRRSHALLL